MDADQPSSTGDAESNPQHVAASASPSVAPHPTQSRRQQHRSPTALLRRHEQRALWIIVLIGLLQRICFLERIPNNVTADELDFASNGLQILTGHGPGFFGLDWTPEPALSIYLISASWQVFGITLFAERLVSALLTTLALPLFYILVRRHVSVPAALAATLLFGSSRWFLHFSRSGWNNSHVVTYMLLTALAITYAVQQPERLRAWYATGVSMALLLYGYFAGRAVAIALAVYLVLVMFAAVRRSERRRWLRLCIGTIAAAMVCAVLIAPEVATIARQLPLFNNRTMAVYIFSEPLKPGQTRIGILADQATKTIRSFFFMDPSLGAGRYKAPNQSWLDPVSGLLYLGGMALAIRRKRGFALWWCLLVIPLALTQLLTRGVPDGARGLAAVAPMYVFVSLALDWVMRRSPDETPWPHWILGAMVVATVGYNMVTYVQWMETPAALAAREPAVPSMAFPVWRDLQYVRLINKQPPLNAFEYNSQPPRAITETIATMAPLVSSPVGQAALLSGVPVAVQETGNVPPRDTLAIQVATIGAAGTEQGQLTLPRDVAVDAQGNYFVIDSEGRKVVKYGADGRFLLEWTQAKSSPAPVKRPWFRTRPICCTGSGANDSPAPMRRPWAISAAPGGTLYVLDTESGRIEHHDGSGTFLGLIDGLEPTISARGMAHGLNGITYVAITPANHVARIGPDGKGMAPLVGNLGNPPLYVQPTSAVALTDSTLFVYESDSGTLLVQSPDGHVRFQLPAPRFSTLEAGGLTAGPGERTMLADAPGRRIIVYDRQARVIGYVPVDGVPQGLAMTPSGRLAVADREKKTVHIYEFTDP